jgi:integral membrane protein
MTPSLSRVRLLGILEGVSFLVLLFIAMPLKYAFGQPISVRYVGMIHGLLFILYLVLLFQEKDKSDWSWKKFLGLFLLSNLPFGFIIVEWKDLYLTKNETP